MTRLALLGFDACDPAVMRSLAAAGKLPAFARLLAEGQAHRVENPYGLFVGSIWPSFFTAQPAARTGFHCWDAITGYERRLTSPREIKGQPFWAGRRATTIDVPHAWIVPGGEGTQVVEYGCHDRHFGLRTWPEGLRAELPARFGLHPVFTIDGDSARQFAPDDWVHRVGERRTPREDERLLRDTLVGLERKLRLSTWLCERDRWDLFISIFGEGHATGHQMWHHHDPTHPWHDRHAAAALGDPLERVYVELDRALAAHLAILPPDTTLLVLCSHGMGPHHDGTHLLEEVLGRLDGTRPRALAGSLRSAASLLFPALATPPTDDIGAPARARRRWFLSPNNSVYGGVRLNLAGREPAGRVRDAGAALDALARELLAIINVKTGRPILRRVEWTAAHHERGAGDELPDLLLDWSHEAPVETVWSPRIGLVHRRYGLWRSGDHTPDGLLLTRGALLPAGPIAVSDLGAAISRSISPP